MQSFCTLPGKSAPGVVGSRTEQIVNLFMIITEIAERGEKSGGGRNDRFWNRALKQLIRNAVDICVAAEGTVSVAMMHKLINSAPRTPAEVHDREWQKGSYCYELIEKGDAKAKGAREQNDFWIWRPTYFLREFIDFPTEDAWLGAGDLGCRRRLAAARPDG